MEQILMFDDLDTKNETSDLKQCTKCGKYKKESEFPKRQGGGRRTECKECTYRLQKERAELRAIHGDPPKDHICPICKKRDVEVLYLGGKTRGPWVIDHNHVTKYFRGWLCHQCNRGIGAFHDNMDLLRNAIEYLSKEFTTTKKDDYD